MCSHVTNFNARNKSFTGKLLQHSYRYHKLQKTFSKLYRFHYELAPKFNMGLKLLHHGLSEPVFYGDLNPRNFSTIFWRSLAVHLGSVMRIHDPKLRNMTHPLSLSVFIAFTGTNFYILFSTTKCG